MRSLKFAEFVGNGGVHPDLDTKKLTLRNALKPKPKSQTLNTEPEH